MSYRASHRFADMSPTKVRSIATLIRDKSVPEARQTLRFLPNRGARLLEKVLESAVANAEDQGAKDAEDLIVTWAVVDEGPRMKRIRPRARGIAFPILKRACHIQVEVDEL